MRCRHCKRELKDGDLVIPIIQWQGRSTSAYIGPDTKFICFSHVKELML